MFSIQNVDTTIWPNNIPITGSNDDSNNSIKVQLFDDIRCYRPQSCNIPPCRNTETGYNQMHMFRLQVDRVTNFYCYCCCCSIPLEEMLNES